MTEEVRTVETKDNNILWKGTLVLLIIRNLLSLRLLVFDLMTGYYGGTDGLQLMGYVGMSALFWYVAYWIYMKKVKTV